MGTGWQWKGIGRAPLVSVAVLCMGSLCFAQAAAPQLQNQAATPLHQNHKKTPKTPKKPPLPPLPSGPTGPMQQIPLDSIAAVPPQVSYQNSQLTIVAPNSTLGDILRAVRKQTGAEIEVPSAPERVVTHLGPGPARDVVAELLNGSRFNYVLLGSPTDDAQLTRVVLVAKSGAENMMANQATPANPQMNQANNLPPQAQQPPIEAANEPEQNDDNALTDDAADQAAAEAEQQQQMQMQQGQTNNPDQPPAIKTPQQMLQEMQQRQMQLQQQQVPGQPPPPPGSGMPPHPPQEP